MWLIYIRVLGGGGGQGVGITIQLLLFFLLELLSFVLSCLLLLLLNKV